MSVASFDFSTLYTNIPHNKLLKVLNELVDFCFKGGGKEFIQVKQFGAVWTDDNNQANIFSKSSLKNSIKYLLDNCYFKFGNKIFKQVIGIPMGSDPAPFMANLFLYYYENKWILSMKKHNLRHARMFSNTFRYLDDLIAINDGNLFEKYHREIYPPELELKKENDGLKETSFLDLEISVSDNKTFLVKPYDKRDSFPFSIVRMPFLCSNIPSKIFYSSMGAEILRMARTTNQKSAFLLSSKRLINRMVNQGANINSVMKTLKKTFGRHFSIFHKFASNSHVFVNELLN